MSEAKAPILPVTRGPVGIGPRTEEVCEQRL